MEEQRYGECEVDEITLENIFEGDEDNRYVHYCDFPYKRGFPKDPFFCMDYECKYYRQLPIFCAYEAEIDTFI